MLGREEGAGPTAVAGDELGGLLDFRDAVEAKKAEGEVPQDGESAWAVPCVGLVGVLAPGRVADVMHLVLDSPVSAEMGVDRLGGRTVIAQAGDDERVFLDPPASSRTRETRLNATGRDLTRPGRGPTTAHTTPLGTPRLMFRDAVGRRGVGCMIDRTGQKPNSTKRNEV
jgi:hypothetical protein